MPDRRTATFKEETPRAPTSQERISISILRTRPAMFQVQVMSIDAPQTF